MKLSALASAISLSIAGKRLIPCLLSECSSIQASETYGSGREQDESSFDK